MKISRRAISLIFLLNFAIFCGTSNAAFLNRDVCTSGCPYSSIQDAINAADDGDTIRVAQGRYFENIVINNSITLTILGGWSQDFLTRSNDPSLTIIDGLGLGSVFHICSTNGDYIDVTVETFTITGGYADKGGGVYAYVGKSATQISETVLRLSLKKNIIENNKAWHKGGGIYVEEHTESIRTILDLTLKQNRIVENRANYHGGGIFLSADSTSVLHPAGLSFLIESNKINGNVAGEYGGGIYANLIFTNFNYLGVPSKIFGNEINGNNAEGDVGGTYISFDRCMKGSLEVINNLVAANWGFEGTGGIMLSSNQTSPTVNIINNTITRNDGYGLGVTSAGSSDRDNFSLNLTNTIINTNQPKSGKNEVYLANLNYGNLIVKALKNHLGPLSKNNTIILDLGGNLEGDPKLGEDFTPTDLSPCVDAGDPKLAPVGDIEENPRTGFPDIGAFEYHAHVANMVSPISRMEKLYPPTVDSIIASEPTVLRPLALGNVDKGAINLTIGLPMFISPVDVYIRAYAPHIDPSNIYQIAPDGSLSLLTTSEPVKWKSGIIGPISESLNVNITSDSLPKGKYYFYLMVTPQNAFGPNYYKYETYLILK
jgi:hypothetical protein